MPEIPMVNSEAVALVDDADAERVAGYRWFTYRIGRTYYAMTEDEQHNAAALAAWGEFARLNVIDEAAA